MNVLTFPVGELQANCYFLIQDKDCVIIDPGDSADFLLEEISRNNLHVKALIATHGHFDHIMAAGEMQMALNIPFYISSKDLFLVKRVRETAKHFLGSVPEIIPIQKTVDLSEKYLKISNFKFQIIPTPGHTPGSTCFYFDKDQSLFTGDTLFKEGIGRYDFSYSNKMDLFESIKLLLKTLPLETTVYCGHGDPTSLEAEKNFLQIP